MPGRWHTCLHVFMLARPTLTYTAAYLYTFYTSIPTYLHGFMPSIPPHLHAHTLTYTPARLHAYVPTLWAYTLAYLHAYTLALHALHTSTPTHRHTQLHTFVVGAQRLEP